MDINYYTNLAYDLLKEYHKGNISLEGVRKNIVAWHENKKPLMDILRKHPQWNEETKAIILSTSQTRPLDTMTAGVEYRKLMTFVSNHFDVSQEWVEKNIDFSYELQCNIDEKAIVFWKEFDPSIKMHNGQKTTRFINSLFKNVQLNTGEIIDATNLTDKVSSYNKIFAKLTNHLSPLTTPIITVLSVNPLDFLLMSNGTNWCTSYALHTHGCVAPLSYMNDGCTMVLYTIQSCDELYNCWKEQKITRQLFHYNDGSIIQCPLYPSITTWSENNLQSVIDVFNTCLSSQEWSTPKHINNNDYLIHEGAVLYPTIKFEEHYIVNTIDNKPNKKIVIGSTPFCVNCEEPLIYIDCLSCCEDKWLEALLIDNI